MDWQCKVSGEYTVDNDRICVWRYDGNATDGDAPLCQCLGVGPDRVCGGL